MIRNFLLACLTIVAAIPMEACAPAHASPGEHVTVVAASEVPAAAGALSNFGIAVNAVKVACFDVADDLTTGENDTGFDFATGDLVLTAWLDVKTAETTAATKTMDMGLKAAESGGDTDGFLDGVSTATAGRVKGEVTITTGTNTKYCASTTRGALLEDFQAGSDVDQDEGMCRPKFHLVNGTAHSLVYEFAAAQNELVGKGCVAYIPATF